MNNRVDRGDVNNNDDDDDDDGDDMVISYFICRLYM